MQQLYDYGLFRLLLLYTNPDFNDPYQVNGMVSGNLYAPFLVMRVFAVLFIVYAQMAFLKFRKSDFGLLMVLGMTSHNIRKIILLENSMIALASILTGLGAGSVFSGLFFFIISLFVNIGAVLFHLHWKVICIPLNSSGLFT